MNLTAKVVAALQSLPQGKRDVIFFDEQLPGFGLRLRASSGGKVLRSWVAQYRRAGGTRRITLGAAGVLSAEQARFAAKKVLAEAALGRDPQGDRIERRAKDAQSFRAVADAYLTAKAGTVRPRTLVESRRYLTGTYFRPLHAMPLDAVTRADVASRILAIARDAGSVTAARARSVINALYSWAMQMGLAASNPVVGAVKPQDSQGRERALTDAELGAVWRTCDGSDPYSRIVRLLILTGARRQEIGGMRWSELDRERGTWTLPSARAKNGRSHTLPLPEAAWRIIEGVPRMVAREQLFGSRAERGFGDWGDSKAELNKRLGEAVAPFVLHDIRRSVATRMADLGIAPHVIEQILNHQGGHKRGVAGIYNRSSYAREVKAAMGIWEDHVRALAEGGEHVIVSMPERRA